jgi:hypothetical protein
MNCNHCGTALPEGAAVCTVCGTAVPAATVSPAELPAKERVGLGILGALIGALIGGASIVLLSQLGYVASISGVIMAFCTVKGYKLLAGRISKTGIILCAILMIVTPFLADAIDWCLVIMEAYSEYGITMLDAFVIFPECLMDGSIEIPDYLGNLGMLYLFVVIGAVGTFIKEIKK